MKRPSEPTYHAETHISLVEDEDSPFAISTNKSDFGRIDLNHPDVVDAKDSAIRIKAMDKNQNIYLGASVDGLCNSTRSETKEMFKRPTSEQVMLAHQGGRNKRRPADISFGEEVINMISVAHSDFQDPRSSKNFDPKQARAEIDVQFLHGSHFTLGNDHSVTKSTCQDTYKELTSAQVLEHKRSSISFGTNFSQTLENTITRYTI